jgi:MinD-like ATPase involved in chromosome partitioning or flagellar assembly
MVENWGCMSNEYAGSVGKTTMVENRGCMFYEYAGSVGKTTMVENRGSMSYEYAGSVGKTMIVELGIHVLRVFEASIAMARETFYFAA